MQLLYNIVIAKPNFPFESLTYSCDQELKIGTVVMVEIKSVILFGIVISQSSLEPTQIKNLKSITKTSPYIIEKTQLEFLKKISFLTFNSLSNLLTLVLKPYETLIDSKQNIFENNPIKKVKENPKLDYQISKEWTSKIIEKISNLNIATLAPEAGAGTSEVTGVQGPKNTGYYSTNILILFPEKNILTKIHKELLSIIKDKKIKIHNLNTTSEKKLLEIYKPLLSIDNNSDINIILGNKNSIFYNLNNIQELIIIDEANPSYISEHRIYFDAREVAFWASKIYGFDLTFISTLPSVRFLDLSKDKLSKLHIPKVNIKFLERQGRQNDFENILLELENNGDLIVDE
jgi:primosomal protein N'